MPSEVYYGMTTLEEEMLNGLFGIETRLEYLTENGDILPTLKKLIPWEDFRSDLEVIYDH